jgi:hypothetical protein
MTTLPKHIKELIRTTIKEMSATGTGASYSPGQDMSYPTPVAGVAKNYYVDKLGFKKVNQSQLNKKSKFIIKHLWGKPLKEEAAFDLQSYLDSLGIDDKELKQHVAGRVTDYDKIESQINELIPLIAASKQDTLNYYKANPSYDLRYSTSTAKEYLDDLIELFQPQ